MINLKNKRTQIFSYSWIRFKAQIQVVISPTAFIVLFLTQLLFSLVSVIKIEINTAKFYVVPHSHFTKILLSNTGQ